MEQVSDLDYILCPIGGGGLTAGCCLAAEGAMKPLLFGSQLH